MDIMLFNTVQFFVLSVIMVSLANVVANTRLVKSLNSLGILDSLERPLPAAFLIRRAGLLFAFLMGTFAVSQNIANSVYTTGGILEGLTQSILIESGLGLLSIFAFVFTALKSADVVILNSAKNDKAIFDNNIAVGVTEASILIGTGLVSYGALLGEGHILSAWVFFLIGQVTFVAVSYLMEYVIHPSHKAKTDIENGSIESALIVSSVLLSVGLFVQNAIAGDFTGLYQDSVYFLKLFGLQFALFVGYMFIAESLLVKTMKLERNEIEGVVVRVVLQLTVAFSIVYNVTL